MLFFFFHIAELLSPEKYQCTRSQWLRHESEVSNQGKLKPSHPRDAQDWTLLPLHNELLSISELTFKAFHPDFLFNLISALSSSAFSALVPDVRAALLSFLLWWGLSPCHCSQWHRPQHSNKLFTQGMKGHQWETGRESHVDLQSDKEIERGNTGWESYRFVYWPNTLISPFVSLWLKLPSAHSPFCWKRRRMRKWREHCCRSPTRRHYHSQ